MLFKLSLVVVIALVGSVVCQVINGVDSDIKKYPFMVSLRNSVGHHICGGTIVAKRFILTAANCVSKKSERELSIQYGRTFIKENSKNVIKVKRIFSHEGFNAQKKTDDIALLELENPIVHDFKAVQIPDALFEVNKTKSRATGVLLGWGSKTAGLGQNHIALQEAELIIYSDEECKSMNKVPVTTNVLCAGVDHGSKGACFGDAGSPLLSTGSIQLGIVSWGKFPCGVHPAVFTKVSHYRDWIEKHLK